MNDYQKMKNKLESLTTRPRLLLHSCCAPCSTHVLSLLTKYFDVTIYYTNNNIFPIEEYERRKSEQIKLANQMDSTIAFLDEEYDDSLFKVAIQGLENLGEKSIRCFSCYHMRMESTARKAKELQYDFFTTTLSVSPHKNSVWINAIGKQLESQYAISFLYSDFKKEGGYQHSVALAKEYALYRQDYCGCVYSFQEKEGDIHGRD